MKGCYYCGEDKGKLKLKFICSRCMLDGVGEDDCES